MPEDILTIREVADYLKVTERTLYRLVQGREASRVQGRELLAVSTRGPGAVDLRAVAGW